MYLSLRISYSFRTSKNIAEELRTKVISNSNYNLLYLSN